MEWPEIKQYARKTLEKNGLSEEYFNRLDEEIYEIEKQGLNDYWVEHITKKTHWDDNPSGLVLPWIFNLTPVDPLHTGEVLIIDNGGVEADIIIIEVDDGMKYEIPADASVMTKNGVVLGRNLKITDELINIIEM